MLCSLDDVLAVPGMANQATLSPTFLDNLIGYADAAIKKFCKQNLEVGDYTEFFSGNDQREIVLTERPVNSITNLWIDPNGNYGYSPNAFGPGTLQTLGVSYALELDRGGVVSNRGLVLRIAGQAQGFIGFWPENYYMGKLGAYRQPVWPRGNGNIKVQYNAGYTTVPPDLTYAAATVVAQMARNMPAGAMLSSESFNGYSYGAVVNAALGNAPELADAGRVLRLYREYAV